MKLIWLVLLAALVTATAFGHARELGKTAVALEGRDVASAETALGNFMADALREATGADIAIIHAMAFRQDAKVEAGIVDEQGMRNLLAMPTSKVATLKLKASSLRALMQRALSKYPDPNMAFLQISGMKVTFDSKQSAAARIVGIEVKGQAVDFTDTTTLYTVAMPRELALGAVGYLLIFSDKEISASMDVTETTQLDAIVKAFGQRKGLIAPKVEHRLTDVQK
jgi:2',3'-cyclic-nucleotide 2'-phosphodiesterase (5'-nucleotidase family)